MVLVFQLLFEFEDHHVNVLLAIWISNMDPIRLFIKYVVSMQSAGPLYIQVLNVPISAQYNRQFYQQIQVNVTIPHTVHTFPLSVSICLLKFFGAARWWLHRIATARLARL